MKTICLVIPMLAMGLTLRTPANGQASGAYSPALEKRADLRLKFWRDRREAGNADARSAQAPKFTVPKEYSGMVDFISLSSKRSDMRLRALKMGYANACEEWMGRCKKKAANLTSVEAAPGFAIPFTFDPLLQPKIIVQIRINGQAPLPFLVDTGLDAGLLIDTQTARKLHLPVDAHAVEIPVGKIGAQRTHVNRVSFLGEGNEALPVGGFDRTFVGDLTVFRASQGRESIAGILGIDMLSQNAVRFDFDAHVLTLFPRSHAVPVVPGAFVLPLLQHKGNDCFFVKTTLQQGIETELLVDTGSEGTGIPISVAQRLHAAACTSSGSGTAYGLSVMPDLLLPSLLLGDCALDQAAVDSLPQTPFGYPIGLNLLSRLRITMDFPNGRMLLEPTAAHAGSARLEGYTGIHVIAKGSRLLVAAIDAGSPAQQAGVQTGDRLISIDGQAAEALPLLTARRLLSGFAGTAAALTLSRPSEPTIHVAFPRLSEFSRPGLPIDGLFLNLPAHQPMEIVGLLAHCVGEQAGLRPGDVILEFNGQATQELTPATLAVEFRKPLVTLTVRRNGIDAPVAFILSCTQK